MAKKYHKKSFFCSSSPAYFFLVFPFYCVIHTLARDKDSCQIIHNVHLFADRIFLRLPPPKKNTFYSFSIFPIPLCLSAGDVKLKIKTRVDCICFFFWALHMCMCQFIMRMRSVYYYTFHAL